MSSLKRQRQESGSLKGPGWEHHDVGLQEGGGSCERSLPPTPCLWSGTGQDTVLGETARSSTSGTLQDFCFPLSQPRGAGAAPLPNIYSMSQTLNQSPVFQGPLWASEAWESPLHPCPSIF